MTHNNDDLMNQERTDADRIVQKIHEAFDDISYPGDDHIVSVQDPTLEAQEIREIYRGKDWRELDAKFLNNYCIQSIFFPGTSGI